MYIIQTHIVKEVYSKLLIQLHIQKSPCRVYVHYSHSYRWDLFQNFNFHHGKNQYQAPPQKNL